MLAQLASLRSSPGVKPSVSFGAGIWAAIVIAVRTSKPQRRRDAERNFIFMMVRIFRISINEVAAKVRTESGSDRSLSACEILPLMTQITQILLLAGRISSASSALSAVKSGSNYGPGRYRSRF
jgi:uncharacterized protein involved in response to NO